MASPTSSKHSELPPVSGDEPNGFFSLSRNRNIFRSSQAIALPRSNVPTRATIRKAWSQDQPTGSTAQILQDTRNMLIEKLKQKVKILAEEAVTKNYIHEQSSTVSEFCAAVEDCLHFGLITRKSSSSLHLLRDVAKSLPEARDVLQALEDDTPSFGYVASAIGGARRAMKVGLPKYQWIRVALLQKTLDKILEYLLDNDRMYYERVSILSHPFDGPLFVDLASGPCTHEYTRIRLSDHLWTDPSAGELMQRKLIYSAGVVGEGSPSGAAVVAAACGGGGGGGQDAQRHRRRQGRPHERLSNGSSAPCQRHMMMTMMHAHRGGRQRQSFDSVSSPTSSSSFQPSHGLGFAFNRAASEPISPASLLYHLEIPDHESSEMFTGMMSASAIGSPGGGLSNGGRVGGRDLFSAAGEGHCHVPCDSLLPPQTSAAAVFSRGKGLANTLSQAKDYVESLHQNERSPLIYGKNNVIVQPSMSSTKISGYLSIHKSGLSDAHGLQLKWAPNRVMSTSNKPTAASHAKPNSHHDGGDSNVHGEEEEERALAEESSYWDFALDIDIAKVVYIHCHRQQSSHEGNTVILVREDGVQYPPLHFSAFSQVISFLQCLEIHLAPRGTFCPPLETVSWTDADCGGGGGDDLSAEVNTPQSPSSFARPHALEAVASRNHICFRIDSSPSSTDSSIPNKPESAFSQFTASLRGSRSRTPASYSSSSAPRRNLSVDNFVSTLKHLPTGRPPIVGAKAVGVCTTTTPVNALEVFTYTCHTMQHKILSRVFYGWLAYSRSINLIRKHLSCLVFPRCLLPKPPPVNSEPLSADDWHKMRHPVCNTANIRLVLERIYFGGCDPALRREVWPFLLGHYPWSASQAELAEIDRITKRAYEESVSEWLAAEAITMHHQRQQQQQRQRDMVNSAVRRTPHPVDRPPLPRDVLVTPTITNNNGSNKQTMEETLPSTRDMNGEVQSLATESGHSPIPPKFSFEPISLKTLRTTSSVDLTTDDEFTLTTTTDDDGDAVDVAASVSLERRLAVARASSCPNSPQIPPSKSNHIQATIRGAQSSGLVRDDTIVTNGNMNALGNLFDPPIVPVEIGGVANGPTRERKRSRFSRDELSGACYSKEVLDTLAVNIHRIDKDVARCDRNYPYFAKGLSESENQAAAPEQHGGLCVASLDISANLFRLRTIMCTWTWQHMDTGYVQGMCDLLATLLVVLDDEALTYACFAQLMMTMLANFPLPGPSPAAATVAAGVIPPHLLESVFFDRAPGRRYEFTRPLTKHQLLLAPPSSCTSSSVTHDDNLNGASTGSSRINSQFESLKNLIEVLDSELADHMHLREENSHLYFYRWLLLDFKREFKYADVFLVWETIWTARRLVCPDFGVFIAFALIQYYRDIILFYCTDYTDIIRFYNERAELHDVPRLLEFARDLIYRLQFVLPSSRIPLEKTNSRRPIVFAQSADVEKEPPTRT